MVTTPLTRTCGMTKATSTSARSEAPCPDAPDKQNLIGNIRVPHQCAPASGAQTAPLASPLCQTARQRPPRLLLQILKKILPGLLRSPVFSTSGAGTTDSMQATFQSARAVEMPALPSPQCPELLSRSYKRYDTTAQVPRVEE
jgi:hypothetical protein